MGFAASQARFLSLTSRLSDNEYEAQQISQERLELTKQMDLFADEYEDAISNEFFYATVYDNEGKTKSEVTLSYDVITKGMYDGGLGMKLVSNSGLIVVKSEEDMKAQIAASAEPNKLTEADFYIFEDVTNTSVLQKNLEEGNFYLAAGKNDQTGDWDRKAPESLSNVSKTYDKADDAVAKAKYDTRMKKAETKDAMLEMRLNQIETSHKAIESEMESLQKVIQQNTETGFKTFG